ncbi:MAG: hypothetical protein ABI824_08835 [Acidobacteriota bacterium]
MGSNKEFRDTLSNFRGAIQQAGEQSRNPGLQMILERGRTFSLLPQLRWAAAVAVLLGLITVPIYQQAEQRREAERVRQDREDALLLQQVNESLSRPVPRAMAVLMGVGN